MSRHVQEEDSADRRLRSYRSGLAIVASGALVVTAVAATPAVGNEDQPASDQARASSTKHMSGIKRVLKGKANYPDPYPIHRRKGWSGKVPAFAGIRMRLLNGCKAGKAIRCTKRTKMHVKVSKRLRRKFKKLRGDQLKKSYHAFQANNKTWHMAMTIKFTKAGTNKGTNVTFHAHPSSKKSRAGVPLNWVIDKPILGHWRHPERKAGYNGRYYYHKGKLYLIHIKRTKASKPTHFSIAARRMKNFKKATGKTHILLSPGYHGKRLASERKTGPILVETGNIRRFNGRYAMIYTVGSYKDDNYKMGVAYSDSFLPKNGRQYRKVVYRDKRGVWGPKKHFEGSYLVQSQKKKAAHYAKKRVKAPGVGSIVSSKGKRYLFFAGYRPSDNKQGGLYKSKRRTPYAMKLKVNIPGKVKKRPLRNFSNRQLRHWIVPK